MYALAVIPAIILLIIVWKYDTVEKEPPALLAKLFCGGALTVISAVVTGRLGDSLLGLFYEGTMPLFFVFIDSLINTALAQEAGKFLVLRVLTWKADFRMPVFQTEQAHLPAVFVIHRHDLRNGLPHLFKQRGIPDHFCLTVIAQEFPAAHGQHFHFGVRCQLVKHILEGAAAEIQRIIDEHLETEGPALGLVSVGGQEIERPGPVQKLVDFFSIRHDLLSFPVTFCNRFNYMTAPNVPQVRSFRIPGILKDTACTSKPAGDSCSDGLWRIDFFCSVE